MRRCAGVLLLLLSGAACQSDSRLSRQRVDPSVLFIVGPRVTELSSVNVIIPEDNPATANEVQLASRDLNYEHIAFGIEVFTQEPGEVGWGYEGSFHYGQGESIYAHKDLQAQFYDFAAGVRLTGGTPDGSRPFFGLGGMYVNNHWDKFALRDDDANPATPDQILIKNLDETAFGAYVHGGVLWRLDDPELNEMQGILLGLDIRLVWTSDSKSAEIALISGWGH